MHKHPCNTPELIKALQDHHLKHDTPSQLADAFRAGWLAHAAATAEEADKTGVLTGSSEL